MVLIAAEELASHLGEFQVLDVRFYLSEPARGRSEYVAGHIPGAVFVDLETELSAPVCSDRTGGRHPRPDPDDLQEAARSWGLRHGADIVVYDQATSLSAGRAWWLLSDAGVSVRVLDGGFRSWQAAGFPVTQEIAPVTMGDVILNAGRFGVVDADQVATRGPGVRLIDVRDPARYRGESEPIDLVAGRIPGAENIPAADLLNESGTFRTPEEIATRLGDLKNDDILSCGSGITAAQVALAAAHAGLALPRVYLGSYSDWISDPNRPVDRD